MDAHWIHGNIIPNGKKVKASPASIGGGPDIQNSTYTYNGMLFSLAKEINLETYYNMDET